MTVCVLKKGNREGAASQTIYLHKNWEINNNLNERQAEENISRTGWNNISILIDDYIFYKIIKMTLHDVFFPLHAILAE